MPAINVNPMRPAAWGLISILGRNESALRKSPAALLRRKAPSRAAGPSEG